MPPILALLITAGLVLWLLIRDRASRKAVSSAMWLPVIWCCIIGSRPVSSWFGLSPADASVEGSPFDRWVFLAVIVAGWMVLWRRRLNWSQIIAHNRWLILLLVYLCLSTLWSDAPFVSFKRWIKEIGNVIMVLIVLSETVPARAVQTLIFRCAVILLPASVVLIKYFPDLGRYYNPFIWTYSYGGVTTDKNALGMTLFICGLGLYWSLLELWSARIEFRREFIARVFLLGICLWLHLKAHCATSLACTGLGIGILSAMKVPAFPSLLQRIGLWCLIFTGVLALFANALFNPLELMTASLGRNATLTGRTDIWREVLQVPINPWTGAGYSNFWQPERAEPVSEALGFYFTLKEAHDGYLEVYLNSGLIGLTLVCIVLLSGLHNCIQELNAHDTFGAFRLAALVGAMFYNVTESALSGLVLLWVLMLLAILQWPRPAVEGAPEFDADWPTDETETSQSTVSTRNNFA